MKIPIRELDFSYTLTDRSYEKQCSIQNKIKSLTQGNEFGSSIYTREEFPEGYEINMSGMDRDVQNFRMSLVDDTGMPLSKRDINSKLIELKNRALQGDKIAKDIELKISSLEINGEEVAKSPSKGENPSESEA